MLNIEQHIKCLFFFCITLTTLPLQNCRVVQFVIDEEIDHTTSIGNLLNHVPGTFNNLRFVKIVSTEDASNLFKVDQYSGEISASSRLDRESLCMSSDLSYYQKFISDDSIIKPKHWKPRITKNGDCELQFSVNCLSTQVGPSTKAHPSPATSKLVTMFDVIVVLQDLNDNGCTFLPADHQIIRIREDAPLHETRIALHNPYDPDNPRMGHSIRPDRIRIQNAQDPLAINPLFQTNYEFQNVFKLHAIPIYKNYTSKKLPGKLKPFTSLVHLELELIGALDYELKSNYTFDIVADDGISMAGHQCHLQVTVLVEDCNDHKPRFEQSVYVANLTEDVPIGHLVAKLKATDEDTGEFGQIIYTLKSYDDEDLEHGANEAPGPSSTGGVGNANQDVDDRNSHANPYFYVNPTNGEVRLQRRLNYRQKAQHSLRVQAENPDQFKSQYGQLKNYPQSMQLFSQKPTDAIAQVLINVIDINDQAPKIRVFSPTGSIFLEIMEESLPGQDVAVIDVFDDDSGVNADLSCQLIYQSLPGLLKLIPMDMERATGSSNTAGTTSLNPSSINGNRKYKISLQKSIDREQITTVEFVVNCWDGGSPSLSTNTSQIIKIIDINDNTPEFEKDVYMLRTYEDSDPKRAEQDFYLATISATDKDDGLNAKLRYSLDHGTPTNLLNILKIDQDTGRLSTTGTLDREALSELSVMVVCTDLGEPPKSAKVLVNINVLDFNDNQPEFVEPNIEFELRENNPIGQLLGSFRIHDKDVGLNAELDIQIEEDSERSHIYMSPTYYTQLNPQKRSYDMIPLKHEVLTPDFDLHSQRRNRLSNVTPQFRLLTQKMKSTSSHDMTTTSDYTIYDVKIYAESVVDREALLMRQTNFLSKSFSGIKTSEHSTQWDHTTHETGVSDTAGNGDTAGVSTIGNDLNLNSNNNNNRNGSYFTPIIVLIIRAADRGMPKLINRASIRIRISDENDNAPRFIYPDPMNPNTTQINVSQREPIGYIFSQIYAIDDDAGMNGTVAYYIHSGNKNGYFKIDRSSGSLSVNQDLSYAPLGEYRLRIEVRDCGQPYRSNFIDIRINLDQSPSKAYLTMDIYKWNSGTIFDFGATGSVLNMYIIIAIVAAAFVISVILLGSIFYFLHRSRRNRIYRHVSGAITGNGEGGNITCKYDSVQPNQEKPNANWTALTKLHDYELEAKTHTFTDIHDCPACTSSYPLMVYPENFGTLNNKPSCDLMNGTVRITPNFEHQHVMAQQPQQQTSNCSMHNQPLNWSSGHISNHQPFIENSNRIDFYIPPQSTSCQSGDMTFKQHRLHSNLGSSIVQTNDSGQDSVKLATVRLPGQQRQKHLINSTRADMVSEENPFNNLQYLIPISNHWQVSTGLAMECNNSILSADCDSGNGDSLEIVPTNGVVHVPRT